MYSLINRTDALVLSIFLLIGMTAMILAGRLASKIWNQEQGEPKGGVNSLFTALFALSGLILAFTFGMSQNRLERVREVVEQEANALGTAILRADLYPDSVRNGFHTDFKNYLEAVIAFYENATDSGRLRQARIEAAKAGEKLWSRTAQQARNNPGALIPSQQMIPALNGMFDIAQTREIVMKSKIPDLIIVMLFVCFLAACFIGGFTSPAFGGRERIIIGGFALVTAMVVYTTLDLARPMRGIITDVPGRDAIVELREMLK